MEDQFEALEVLKKIILPYKIICDNLRKTSIKTTSSKTSTVKTSASKNQKTSSNITKLKD